jgi:hypothetical protein
LSKTRSSTTSKGDQGKALSPRTPICPEFLSPSRVNCSPLTSLSLHRTTNCGLNSWPEFHQMRAPVTRTV